MLSYVLTVNNTSPNGPKASITKAVKPTQLSLSLSSGTVGTANVELNALIKKKKKSPIKEVSVRGKQRG